LTIGHDLFRREPGEDDGPGTRRFSPRLRSVNTSFTLDSNSWLFRVLGLVGRSAREAEPEEARPEEGPADGAGARAWAGGEVAAGAGRGRWAGAPAVLAAAPVGQYEFYAGQQLMALPCARAGRPFGPRVGAGGGPTGGGRGGHGGVRVPGGGADPGGERRDPAP